MAKEELLDSHISLTQCKKAVDALLNHATKIAEKREEHELLPRKEENVWLVLAVKKIYPERTLKPFKIPLAHPLVDPRTTPICLITKDPQREYKDLLASHNIKFISRVVGITKLKGKWKPFEARRLLLKENGMFLADDRVVPLLPRLLGVKFFDAKKQPIPVCLTRKDLKGELERAVSSTYMHQNQGNCTSVKIGTVSQTPAQILDNLKCALPAIAQRIRDGWDNVQSFHIKTTGSVSLPVWACELGQGKGARWEEKAVVEAGGEWSGFGASNEASGADEVADVLTSRSKGKKRSVRDETELPIKRAKKDDDNDSAAKPATKSSAGKKVKPDGVKSAVQRQALSDTSLSDRKSMSVISKPDNESGDDDASDGEDEEPRPKSEKKVSKSKTPTLSSSTPSPIPKKHDAKPPKSTLTLSELKQKRDLVGVAKKKEKILQGKGGKGVKERIIGKAASARI